MDMLEIGIDTSRLEESLRELKKVAATTVLSDGDRVASTTGAKSASGVAHRADDEPVVFYNPVGCDACSHTGYRGRVGIFELMIVNEPVRREILKNSDAKDIQKVAVEQGMRLLRDDGARQVIAGVTSVDEVLAATQAAE